MSSPSFDLSKVDYTSVANSFKTDNQLYTGTITIGSLSVPAGGSVHSTQVITVAAPPEFSTLYGYFQEVQDAIQQSSVGSGYNSAAWYETSFAQPGIQVTTAPFQSFVSAFMYVKINGTEITIAVDFNNPYAATVTYNSLVIPYAFVVFTLTS